MVLVEPTLALSGEDFAEDTLGHHLETRLFRLLRALGQEEKLPRALMVARALSRGWSHCLATRRPAWPSDITDDHTPFEFSLAFDGRTETLRLLTEPQDAGNPSLTASWQTALQIHDDLAARWGTHLDSFAKIADLFAPTAATSAIFSVWHSAILGDARDPQFKLYLNPAIHGPERSHEVLSAALARLGLDALWRDFAAARLGRGGFDQPVYLSLDLLGTPEARVKLYVAHRAATARELAHVFSGCPGFDAPDVLRWCRGLLGGVGPFTDRPPISCFALCPGAMQLHSTTLHLPVRSYLPDDFEIARRACSFLSFPQRVRFMRAITALSERPLDSGRGLQTYVSLRASPGKQAVTVYLAPLLYSTQPDARDETAPFFSGPLPAPQSVPLHALSSRER